MRLDPNLHRDQLLQIENLFDGTYGELTLEVGDTPFSVFNEHLKLLQEGGFIEAFVIPDVGENIDQIQPIRLTFSGHQYLAAIRDPDIWRKTERAATSAGSWTFGLLRDVATAYARQKIAEVTGVAL
jgi:hypothetical protein